MKISGGHVLIGRDRLTLRQRLKWRIIFAWRWLRGEGSFDGRTKYVRPWRW